MLWMRQKTLSWGMGFCWYHIFYLINKTFTFKLIISVNKFGFAGNIWVCLSANITIHSVVTGIINEPLKLQTSWNLRVSALEPKPSSLFWLHTSVDVASDTPASWSVDSTSLFISKNVVCRLFFCSLWSLASVKSMWFKTFMSESIVRVKRPDNQRRNLNWKIQK